MIFSRPEAVVDEFFEEEEEELLEPSLLSTFDKKGAMWKWLMMVLFSSEPIGSEMVISFAKETVSEFSSLFSMTDGMRTST